MRCLKGALGLCTILIVLASQATAEIVTPSSAKATSQFGLGIEVGNLINGSGLDGVGPEEDQLHGNDNATMWFSGCADGGIPGGTPAECPTGFEVAPVDEQIVEFELDATYDLTTAHIWNYNELSGIGPLPGRGVKTFELLVSPSRASPFVSVGTFELAQSNDEANPQPAEPISIDGMPGTDAVRRVRFRIIDAHHGNAQDYVGLSEVRFEGTEVDPVPEPVPTFSEWCLYGLTLTLILTGALLVHRRQRRWALARCKT